MGPHPDTDETSRASVAALVPEADTDGTRVRWEERTQVPLLWLAVAFGAVYAVPILFPGAPAALRRGCSIAEWLIWGCFALDYGIRWCLAHDRWQFTRRHPFALAAVVLPFLQPLRLTRLVAALLLVGQRARLASQIRVTTYVAGSCVGLLLFGSLAVLEVERESPTSNIRSMGDAMWWAFTTMTTVGYGDTTPTTTMGRLLAVGLMLSGIALLGVVTANIAAWFIARFEREDDDTVAHTRAIEELTAEVRTLRAEVAALTARARAAGEHAAPHGSHTGTRGDTSP
ncbi:potassium channel family protein [Streptomyces specialis]|uniref:potassium channel family protein n=1 Tax=Streptomyces specialis TaxID=498367 RepID=UPI00099E2B9E|nr:potassium channel family protein [Streptomyces specialis]